LYYPVHENYKGIDAITAVKLLRKYNDSNEVEYGTKEREEHPPRTNPRRN